MGRFAWPRRRKAETLCALDIGTTKVCALIGRLDEEGLQALGVGTCESQGLQRGSVMDIPKTVQAINKALMLAEDYSRTSIREVVVGIAGDHIESFNVEAMIEIPHSQRGIGERDITRVTRKARENLLTPRDKHIVHEVPQSFKVNGHTRVVDPVGLCSEHLGVRLHLILASAAAERTLMRCLQRARLRSRVVALESIASSLSVLSDYERRLGVALIDIGGGTADIAVFKDNCIRSTSETPLGGNVITQDIQNVWNVSFETAEKIKKSAGTALPMSVDAEDTVELPSIRPSKPTRRKRRQLGEIIEARVEEILMMARDNIEKDIPVRELQAGVVLTGGTAMLDGIDKVAERVFDLKCRIGYPQRIGGLSGSLASPVYSTAVGLLHYCNESDLHAPKRWWRF